MLSHIFNLLKYNYRLIKCQIIKTFLLFLSLIIKIYLTNFLKSNSLFAINFYKVISPLNPFILNIVLYEIINHIVLCTFFQNNP